MDLRNQELGVGVRGLPDSWTKEQGQMFLRTVHAQLGQFVGNYEAAASQITGLTRPTNPQLAEAYDRALAQTAAAPEPTLGEQARSERGYSEEDLQTIRRQAPRDRFAQAWDETMGATRDLLSAGARGLAPSAAAAVAGAPFGPIGSATAAAAVPVADALVQLTNAAFGTEWATPSEAVKDLLTRTGAVDVPESDVMQWFENAVQQLGAAGAFSGLMKILSRTPGVARSGRTNPQGSQIDPTGSPTGFGSGAGTTGPATVPTTTGRQAAEMMSFGPAGQMAGAIGGSMTEQGVSQALVNARMKPEWAQLLGTAAGVPADMLTGGLADRISMGQLARDLPISDPRLARQAQLAEDYGAPLRADEAIGNPINDPSVRDLSRVSQRARTSSGTGDYFQARVRNARDAGRQIAEDYGVTYSGEMSNVVEDATPEVMQIFNSARNEDVTQLYNAKRNIIETLSDPNDPVDVSRSLDVVDKAMDRFARLGENIFGDAGRRLSGLRSDLSGPHSLEDIETIRKAIYSMKGEDLVPQGARGEYDKVIDELYSTLRDDMGMHIQSSYWEEPTTFGNLQVEGTEVREIWQEADEKLAGLMDDFRHQDIDTMINEAAEKPIQFQSVEAVQGLHRANRDPSQYRKLYSRLDEEGRRLSESAIFANIIEQAGGPLNASPTSMAASMQEYMPMLRAIAAESGDSEIVERTTHFVDYVTNVVDWIEGFVGSGLKESRLSLTEHPTGGIALSQGSRQLGLAGALFLGDMIQFGVGKTARRLNKPENMQRIMNIRQMETGSQAWRQATNALLRDVYRDELNEEEAREE